MENKKMDVNEVYPFEVSSWVETDPSKPSFLGKAFWMEMARCRTEMRAIEVAESLHIRHKLVRVSQLQGTRFVPVQWYPDRETVERETK